MVEQTLPKKWFTLAKALSEIGSTDADNRPLVIGVAEVKTASFRSLLGTFRKLGNRSVGVHWFELKKGIAVLRDFHVLATIFFGAGRRRNPSGTRRFR